MLFSRFICILQDQNPFSVRFPEKGVACPLHLGVEALEKGAFWLAQCLAQRKFKRNILKEKRKTDKRRKHFFHTFLYLLGEWTNQRYVPRRSVVPQNTRQSNRCCRFDVTTRKEVGSQKT